jgi:hypothetical protein
MTPQDEPVQQSETTVIQDFENNYLDKDIGQPIPTVQQVIDYAIATTAKLEREILPTGVLSAEDPISVLQFIDQVRDWSPGKLAAYRYGLIIRQQGQEAIQTQDYIGRFVYHKRRELLEEAEGLKLTESNRLKKHAQRLEEVTTGLHLPLTLRS